MPLKRVFSKPIITREDVPDNHPIFSDISSVFNPGAIRYQDKIILLLRVQDRGRRTFLLKAFSEYGKQEFSVDSHPVDFIGIDEIKQEVYHIYDPRITFIDNRYYIMFAMDTDDGCKLGLGVTDDFTSYKFMGLVGDGDIRNGVLFSEKINGKYMRLDRPNKVQLEGGPSSGSTIWLSESEDLINWLEVRPVAHGRPHFWDELIGSGPPPVKTEAGWLHIYHGVATHFGSSNIYQAGVLLLDLNDPSRVINRGKCNILEPRESWELTGQVPNVVFPSGIIVDKYDEDGFADLDSQVFVYYGAADTSVAVAQTTIRELLEDSEVD
jgi:beta-1,4-mannooligosaccharide/beta-1,4-mannosyl-N-acetylglucosamine phosphorylase